ncbi:MAG: glutamine--fructose-6-phosphate transaminase (isomerizing) [Methanocorpusculum sp.]|nr:glutamine--fructose-6-phosphate transaminase (isomerizing) [Methanocorpusculum sp.]
MCGIVGYLGYRQAAEVCMEGLLRLEYRGYDSFGIATVSPEITLFKETGKISAAKDSIHLNGTCGIGHTRWATHGVPSKTNAHPFTDCTGKLAVVHNGIIENYAQLKRELEERGHTFVSETDTEVIPHLIEEQYAGNLCEAVAKILPLLEGAYAILVITEDTQEIVAARKGSPLVLGIGDNEYIFASDGLPILDYTRRVIYLEDGDLADVTPAGYTIYHGAEVVERKTAVLEWDAADIRKGGFAHYMLKEMYEQPEVFSNTASSIAENPSLLCRLRDARSITIVACGTSANAATVFAYLMETVCGIPTRVVLASEFKYYPTPKNDVVIAVSQSGETADTIAALKIAKEKGAKTFCLTNVLGSSLTRTAETTFYTRAGPEVSVAATKSFTAQVAAFMEMVNIISGGKLTEDIAEIQRYLPEVLEYDVDAAVELVKDAATLLYVGRGLSYPIALEGALKMKEISYIHAEGYAAGELKHGPFALLSESTPVVAVCLSGITYPVMMSNLKEMKARCAPEIVLGNAGDLDAEEIADVFIPLPKVSEIAGSILASVVLQMLAYKTAVSLGTDVDMPRNLAKSVTVE